MRFEIRSLDSIIVPLTIVEIGVSFSLFHHESLVSKVYRRDTRNSSSEVKLCHERFYKSFIVPVLGPTCDFDY